MAGLLILSSFDLLAVGRRYLNEENFTEKEEADPGGFMAATNAPLHNALSTIQQQDKDPHYRVFNVTGDVFNDALTSYYVRSIGGYHPAKLSVYQDIIENQLSTGSPNMEVLNMLDTKYFVVPGEQGPQVQQNPNAYGAAWFAKHINYVPDAAAEMKALSSTNLKDSVVVQSSFKSNIATAPQWDSAASIKLELYDHDVIVYSINTATPQFAVLSEIYYSRGWNAYADGKQVPIVKTNYALRGVAIPAGTKKLELKFEPQSYKWGSMITTIVSILVLLLLTLGFYMEFGRKKNPLTL
jgi:hypothetical protein